MAVSGRIRDFLQALYDCISYITVFWWWVRLPQLPRSTRTRTDYTCVTETDKTIADEDD